ncbi:MAG: hypothetical protein ACOCW5_05215 [Spirochaetia bacterium]
MKQIMASEQMKSRYLSTIIDGFEKRQRRADRTGGIADTGG